jgi:signal transduction histidine kinase
MTAKAPATVQVSMTTESLPVIRLNSTTPQQHLFYLLLTYRWATLLPGFWFLLAADATVDFLLLFFLLLVIGSTLFVSFLSRSFNPTVLEASAFLGADILGTAALVALSGATQSPYYWFALSSLLAGALLFRVRGAVLSATAFTSLYLLALFFVVNTGSVAIQLEHLGGQLAGVWLIPLLFGYPLEWLQRLPSSQALSASTDPELIRRHTELESSHRQLQIVHDLTLLLQGASDMVSVQQRVLQVVTAELGFPKAIVGLVNPLTQSLGNWHAYPAQDEFFSAIPPLALKPENGLIARKLLDRRGRWWLQEEPLVSDEALEAWLSQTPWLILPLVLPEQSVGVLLVAVEAGPGSLSEDQLVALTAVASQAAAALGAIEHTQRLAVEQERNRIARDIHDTVAQSLFGIVFTLDACIKMLPRQAETVREELVSLREVADEVRHEVRRSILDTWPSDLTQEQFKTDLSKYVAHCAPAHAFNLDVTVNGDFDRLPSSIRRGLYRVSQEALANTARHARVDSARLTMHVEPEEVYLSITDRGRGFEPKLALAREYNREHFGLRGMCERVQAFGGTCDILSQVGHGTQVLVRVPVKRGK